MRRAFAPTQRRRRATSPLRTTWSETDLTCSPLQLTKTQESVMSETSPSRRDVLAATAAAGALLLNQEMVEAAEDNGAIRPFRVNVPEEKLVDLRRRIAAAQWPEKEQVQDSSQGVQLRTMQS